MNITHTKLITVPVSDQDRAKAFYVDTLGFEVVVDQQAGPMRWLQVAPKGAQTSFTLAKAAVGVEGPADRPWGREATVIDPDGNRLVLAAPTTTSR